MRWKMSMPLAKAETIDATTAVTSTDDILRYVQRGKSITKLKGYQAKDRSERKTQAHEISPGGNVGDYFPSTFL
jgi:hypothetical protein